MITTITRSLCSTALALAALTATAASQDLDGRWFQVSFRARVAAFVELSEIDGGYALAPKAKVKTVKSSAYVKLHFDGVDEIGGELYRTQVFADTPDGLVEIGDSELRIVGGAFTDFELFVFDLASKGGELTPKAMVSASFAGKIAKKTDGEGDVTKATLTSLGGLVEDAVVLSKDGETACYAVGGARIKARLLTEKKVAKLPPVIDD